MGGEWVSSERIWNNSQKFIVRHTPHTPLLYEGTDSNSDFPSIVCSVAHYGERVSFQLVVVIYAWQLIHNDNGSIRQALIVWQVQVLPLISPDSNQLYYTILNSAPKYVLYHAANPLYLEATHWDDLPNQARTNFLDLHDSSLNFHKTTQQSCAMALFGTNLDAIQSACEYLMIFQPAAKVLRALFTLSCTGCDVYMCDFHCEQRWEHWTVTAKHGVSNVKDQVLTQLRRIARQQQLTLMPWSISRPVHHGTITSVCSSGLRRNGSHSIRWVPFYVVSWYVMLATELENLCFADYASLHDNVNTASCGSNDANEQNDNNPDAALWICLKRSTSR